MNQSPYRLNPYEQSSLQTLAAGLANGLDPQFAYGIYDQTLQGAMQRREQNLATREQGLSGLQDLAMQLAQSGVDSQTVTNLVTDRANDLPLMNNKRGQQMMGDIQGTIGGWYPDGTPVSTLVPPEQRQAMLDALGPVDALDDADKGAVGQLVTQGIQQGVPFDSIREMVRQQAIGAGQDPAAYIAHAEDAYQQITGTSLADMRSAGDTYRNFSSGLEGAVSQLRDKGLDVEGVPGTIDPQQLFANVVAQDPRSLGDVTKLVGGIGAMQSKMPVQGGVEGAPSMLLSEILQGLYDKYAPQAAPQG